MGGKRGENMRFPFWNQKVRKFQGQTFLLLMCFKRSVLWLRFCFKSLLLTILWIYPSTKDAGSSPPGWSETSDDIISLDWGISIMNLQFLTIASWGPGGRSKFLEFTNLENSEIFDEFFANLYGPTFKAWNVRKKEKSSTQKCPAGIGDMLGVV